MRFARLAALALLVLLGCGKEPLDTGPVPRWDPPTEANGFRPVERAITCPSDAYLPSQVGTSEDVATVRVRSLAAHAGVIYWTGTGGMVESSLRMGTRWARTRLAVAEDDPSNLVVSGTALVWTTSGPMPAVRSTPLSGGRVQTLAREAAPVDRLVAHGEDLVWTAPPNHVRIARSGTTSELFTTTYDPRSLAIDASAVYLFSADARLLRIDRASATARVLVPSADQPVDLAVDGGWVYWLERGPGSPCPTAYVSEEIHPKGALRRVPRRGGVVETLAAGLPDVEHLVVADGIAWVTTRLGGVLMFDPRRPAREIALGIGRIPGPVTHAALVGDGLALAVEEPVAHITLLSRP